MFFAAGLTIYRAAEHRKTVIEHMLKEAQQSPAKEAMEAAEWDFKTIKLAMHNLDERTKKAERGNNSNNSENSVEA